MTGMTAKADTGYDRGDVGVIPGCRDDARVIPGCRDDVGVIPE